MSRTRGHRKCARAKCGVCSGMVAVRQREISPAIAALKLDEQRDVVDALGRVHREVWETEYACLRTWSYP